MNLLPLATQLLTDYFKGDVSSNDAKNAITGLLGDGQGGINIADLVSKMMSNSNLSGLVGSWLGDGENNKIQAGQVKELFSGDALSSFSQSLGQSEEKATEGLSSMLSQLIDKNSSGGDLSSGITSLGGALNFAKKLF